MDSAHKCTKKERENLYPACPVYPKRSIQRNFFCLSTVRISLSTQRKEKVRKRQVLKIKKQEIQKNNDASRVCVRAQSEIIFIFVSQELLILHTI